MEQHEAWSTGRIYFDMTEYWQWRKENKVKKYPVFQASSVSSNYALSIK